MSKLRLENSDKILQESLDYILIEDFVIKINNVDKTSLVDMPSFSKTDALYSAADILKFTILSHTGQSYIPEGNDIVEVMDGSDKIFGGVIVQIEKNIDLATNIITHTVTCKDYGQYLSRNLVIERIENKTVNEIIEFLLIKYASDFTDTFVNCTIPVTSITFNNITVAACLDKLSKLTNYQWYADYDKAIHFFSTSSEVAPFNITDNDGNLIPDTLTLSEDLSQLKNRITVRGGEIEVNEVSFEITGDKGKVQDNGNTTFDTSYKFARKPTVTVNGLTKLVGVVGFDNDDIDYFDAMWSFEQKYLVFKIYIDPADDLVITGTPLETLQVRVQDSASIVEYGRWETVLSVPGIKSREEALQYGEAQLATFKDPQYSGKFQTYRPGLRSGQTIRITSAKMGIDEDFFIQRVNMRMLTNSVSIWEVEVSTSRQVTLIDILGKIVELPELKELATEGLLSYIEFTNDTAVAVDDGISITTTTGPYYVWPDVGTGTDEKARVGFSTVAVG